MKAQDVWEIRPEANDASVIRGDNYRITVLTSRLVRLEYEECGQFQETATQLVLCRAFPAAEFRLSRENGVLTVETEALTLRYDEKPLSANGLSISLRGGLSMYRSQWHYGEKGRNLGGTVRTLDGVDGETHLEDGLNAFEGYAVLDDSRSMGMDAEGRLFPRTYAGTDLYFFGYGRDYKGCIRDFLRLSGRVPVVPRFALGNFWSRFYPYTQDEYKQLMETFREHGIPLSVSVLDMNWHVTKIDPAFGSGWTGYTWDREKFPEPEKLLAWLHAQGLRVTLNEHPADGIRPFEDSYAEMAKKLGEDPDAGKSFPFDAASETYLQALSEAVLMPLEEQGVDFWWIDWQQRGGTSDIRMDPLFVLNHSRFLHALESGRSPLILSRYAGPGSHRYPLGFSGDTCATWASLDFQPFFTASAANIAYGFWSHDIGGHMHGTTDPELMARWVQFGVFSPVMRLHSSNNIFMEKEPWKLPPREEKTVTSFLRLSHRLVPWLYSQNVLSSEKGEMLLRPMYFDDPEDRAAYGAKNQYRLGDCMTVCPVTEPMDGESQTAKTKVWLPEGIWTDFFTGLRYRGGRLMHMYRALEEIPVLVKAGGIVPIDASECPENGCPLPETVLVRFFPGDGETVLIEDNGLLPTAPGYRRVTTRIRMHADSELSIEILPPEGDISLLPAGRRYIVEVCGIGNIAPDTCSCAVTSAYDGKRRSLTLTCDACASQGLSLQWAKYEVPGGIRRTAYATS